MLKYYMIGGKCYQYEEGEQPAGAVELKKAATKAAEPEKKVAPAPANKSRRVKGK